METVNTHCKLSTAKCGYMFVKVLLEDAEASMLAIEEPPAMAAVEW